MTHEDKLRLLNIAQAWADDTITSWFDEFTAWDGWIEDEVLTLEEYEWIRENVIISTKARLVE